MLHTSADGDTREVPVGKEQSSTVLTGLRPGVEYGPCGLRGTGRAGRLTPRPTGNKKDGQWGLKFEGVDLSVHGNKRCVLS